MEAECFQLTIHRFWLYFRRSDVLIMSMVKKQRMDLGDAENTAFGIPEILQDHKPGYDDGDSKRKVGVGGDHRFKRSDKKAVPQESLAVRIGKSKKGK